MVAIKEAVSINTRHNLKEYWNFVKRYKLMFYTAMFLVFINSLAHLIDRFLFKVVVDDGTLFVGGTLLRNDFVQILFIVLIAYLSSVVIRMMVKWVHLRLLHRLEARVIRDLKAKYFNHILHLSHGFHTTHKTGSLISRLIRGSSAAERMTEFIILNILPLVTQLVLVCAAILYFDLVTGLVIGGVTLIFVAFGFILIHFQRGANLKHNNTEDIEKANISDIFTNIDSIKYYGKEGDIMKRYASLNEDTRKAAVNAWKFYEILSTGQSFILAMGTLVLVLFPILRLLEGEITLGTVVFIYTSYELLHGPLYGFISGTRGFYRSMADFESLFQYGQVENDIKDSPDSVDLIIRDGKIEFKNIDFSYHKRQLFNGFNLAIKPNEKVALVGHSGCGKTTLVKLLYRLYDVEHGEILIDGMNINTFKQESLRGELSVVPQEAVLFDDTIYNNILFSRPEASREEVFEAIKFAQLDRFIQVLPHKEDTIVGERGVRLSGGEKQRVSIARAILANKRVLVLDEATSSLDSMTEHEIQQDLAKLMQGRTTIIIAHRLSTIMKADKIIVMQEGKIVQMGSHIDLLKKKGLYKELWELQKGGFIDDQSSEKKED